MKFQVFTNFLTLTHLQKTVSAIDLENGFSSIMIPIRKLTYAQNSVQLNQ